MRPTITLPALLLAVFCLVPFAPAKPSAGDVARAGALAAQIKTPAVRAAVQCRVAFADTTAAVPVKDRADTAGAGVFWTTYLKKLHGIDVEGCPDDFRAAFDRHVRAVKLVAEPNRSPASPEGPKVSHAAGYGGVRIPDPAVSTVQIKGRRDAVGDCGATYQAVFTAANRSMKTAPAGDGQLAGQIDALLKE